MDRGTPRLEARTRWLIVRLAGVEHAVAMDAVREMMQLRGQTLEAVAPRGAFRYRVRLHNAWIPVAVVHPLLGLKAKAVNARSCLVLAERRGSGGTVLRYALVVDSISRAQDFSEADMQRRHPETGQPFPGCLGRLRWNEKWHPALDLEGLLPWSDLLAATQAPHAA